MRSFRAFPLLHGNPPGPGRVVRLHRRRGLKALTPKRPIESLLTRLVGTSLDLRLAAGAAPESSRWLAARAYFLVCPQSRVELARDWLAVLSPARGRTARASRIRPDPRRVLGLEPEIRQVVERLRAPLPVGVRGVAAARCLLMDGTSPLYVANRDPDLAHMLALIGSWLNTASECFPVQATLPAQLRPAAVRRFDHFRLERGAPA